MENGLTSQLTPSVTATPRQCRRTIPSAAKSIFISMGMIISQTSPATGRLIWATSRPATTAKAGANPWPSATPATMHSRTQRVR
jgi:hypothetical protein